MINQDIKRVTVHKSVDLAISRKAFREAHFAKPTFTAEQGAVAFDREGLGSVIEWTELEANPTNCVYKAVCRGGSYIVKIKYRKAFSLTVEHNMTALLRDTTILPVPEICVLCEDTDAFGYPYLVSSLLPGIQGRDFFEMPGTSDDRRCRLLKEFGSVIAFINEQKASDGLFPVHDMTGWRDDIRRKLLDNRELAADLPEDCRARLPVIDALLDKIDIVPGPSPQGLLWGDAAIHNLLVDEDGHIVGIHDFENAATGDLLHEQLHVAAEFNRKPREIYGRPHYPKEFWSGYVEAGGVRIEPDDTYLKVRQATRGAGLFWFWEVLGVFHPRTPQWLDDLEGGLRSLVES